MEFSLERVRKEPFSWHETVLLEVAELDRAEVVALGEIDWRGKVEYAESGFYFSARFDYEQAVACTRCLKPSQVPVRDGVDLFLIAEPSEMPVGELQLEEQDLGVLVVRDDKVDTRSVLLEQVQLHVPMKTVCSEDCRGLCPGCGADLNEGACSCEAQTADPRWSALEAMRDRLQGEG